MTASIERLCLLCLLGCAGCAMHEIDVGEAMISAAVVDISSCYGERTSCERPQATVPVLQHRREALECPQEPQSAQLNVVWKKLIPLSNVVSAVALDGSLWIAASMDAEERGAIMLERYSAAGELLSHVEIPSRDDHDYTRAYPVRLEMNGSGRGVLVVSMTVADRARGWVEVTTAVLIALDERGEPISPATELAGGSQWIFAIGNDDALVFGSARDGQLGVVGRLDPALELTWVQNQTSFEYVNAIAGDDRANVFVLGKSARQSSAMDTPPQHLAMFDEDGNLAWEIESSLTSVSMLPARDGDVIIAGQNSELTYNGAAGGLEVTKIDGSGNAVWSKHLAVEWDTDVVLSTDQEENMYVSARESLDFSKVVLVRLDRDAQHCAQLVLPPDISSLGMMAAPNGSIFVQQYDELDGSWIMLLAR